jgi:molybdenum cofactor cytidylyltransferase
MKLLDAFPFENTSIWAFVGSGGKTSTIFSLVRQYKKPIIVTTTTHLSLAEVQLGDYDWIMDDVFKFPEEIPNGILVITAGDNGAEKVEGLNENQMNQLSKWALENKAPMLIEADGSRGKPLKAPADYEPAIPAFVNRVIVVAGMGSIHRPLTANNVHRPNIFAELAGIEIGEIITARNIQKVLAHPLGGLKNIPVEIDKTLLLTQISNQPQLMAAKDIAKAVSGIFSPVIMMSDGDAPDVIASIQPIAGVILAAGDSTRLGRAKQFLDWKGKPFIQVVAENAINAGLSPVIVVTGEAHEKITDLLAHLPVTVVHNQNWQEGQGTSVSVGVRNLPNGIGGAIFLLVDQPQIKSPIIETLISEHSISMSKIVAPLIDNQRGNPVLFDKSTFIELAKLKGEKGGRKLFSNYHVRWVPWVDDGALLDVDTEENYQRLLSRYP